VLTSAPSARRAAASEVRAAAARESKASTFAPFGPVWRWGADTHIYVFMYGSRTSVLETPHSTNETGATNCYTQKTEEKEARRQTPKHRRQVMAS